MNNYNGVFMEKKIGKNAILLIINDMFYSLISVFVETFLVAYFLKITNESIRIISIYYIIIYFLRSFGNVLMGKIIKKYSLNAKKIMCVGIIMRAMFILFIAMMADKIAANFIWIAILYAIAESFYWCAHELIYELTNNYNRKNYITNNRILIKVIKIVSPIILGASIELYSFSKIAIYVFVLTIIQIIISLLINTNIKDNEQNKYSYKSFLKCIKENKLKKIRRYSLSSIAYGIVESSIKTLIVIITVMTFKTSFSLGALTTIFNIFSMLSLMLYNKFYNAKKAKFVLGLCATIVVLSVFGLLININKTNLIIYNFCYTITFAIFDAVYNTRKGDLVKECGLEKYREEYIGYTLIYLCMGRIIGYILMLIVSFTNDIIYFKILLAVVTLFAPIYCYLNVKSLKE